MNFERFFKLSSYALIFGGLLALVVAGGVGVLVTLLFVTAAVTAWFFEGTKWQLSERTGLILIFAMLPLFYLDWKYKFSGGYGREQAAVATLARLILALAAIKLLQVKTDRDWFVLYIISFFQILLAAGFSISPLLAASFIVYLFIAVTTIIAFEIRKSARKISDQRSKLLDTTIDTDAQPDGARKKPRRKKRRSPESHVEVLHNANYRFPIIAVNLLILTLVLAVPLFFFLPRVGSAGLGAGARGLPASTGFSEIVTLGGIATIQQNSEIVMRVKIEGSTPNFRNFKWRGVALDEFDKRSWKKSRLSKTNQVIDPIEEKFFILGHESGNNRTVTQTIFLEPLDTPVVFGLPQMVGLRGDFDSIIRDNNDSITMGRLFTERMNYKVISDTYLPPEPRLRNDNGEYSFDKHMYMQLPANTDARFAQLTREVIEKAGAKNRFDAARAVEGYLKNNLGYTLDLKAGGEEPLADFLFNIREGHCEYFASAMAIMLRTQGIGTRIVNGFQAGQYNETADMYIVRQKDAHSWVEVYFPGENVWVPFDPTPAAGLNDGTAPAGIMGSFGSYIEALESMWVEYVVAYDNQEQRSMVKSIQQFSQGSFTRFSNWANTILDNTQKTWREISGREGYEKQVSTGVTILIAVIAGLTLLFLLINAVRYLWRSGWLTKLLERMRQKNDQKVITFYARMIAALQTKGFVRAPYQTPLEFAGGLSMPEAVRITEAYNSVRYGERPLTRDDENNIEQWLSDLEAKPK